jgi:predicted transcriptional regulator with HTH domain
MFEPVRVCSTAQPLAAGHVGTVLSFQRSRLTQDFAHVGSCARGLGKRWTCHDMRISLNILNISVKHGITIYDYNIFMYNINIYQMYPTLSNLDTGSVWNRFIKLLVDCLKLSLAPHGCTNEVALAVVAQATSNQAACVWLCVIMRD